MTTTTASRHRAALTITDQGVSSITNLLIALVVARAVAPADFGLFSAFFLLYVLALGAARAVTSEPMIVRFSTGDAAARRAAAEDASGTTVVLGGGLSIGLLLVAPWLSQRPGSMMLALAVVLPGLLLQDVLRFVALFSGRPAAAVANDALWLSCVAVGALVTSSSWSAGTWVPLLVWGVGANISALVSAWYLRVRPRPSRWRPWLTTHRDLGTRYLAEFLAVQASGQITVYLVGMSSGLRQLAALRGGQVLFGPFHVFDAGARQLGIPELTMLRAAAPRRYRHAIIGISAGLAAVAIAIGTALLALPDTWGRQLLGGTWTDAQPVLLPLTLQKTALALSAGAFCGLRVLGSARLGLRARGVMAVLAAACGYAGAVTYGAIGAALGMASGQLIGTAMYWRTYRRAEREARLRTRRPDPQSSTIPRSRPMEATP